jgi:L-cysteine:1D-myo-inositol 2-amino-2-deoxy-alpha-D-glucopyranoside ligase
MIELARERGGNPDDPRRRDPLDFVLWRPSGPDEPKMASPWGEGLPGWHVECSAMSLEYLGEPIDIHGGGADLIFPHHENEIAQSEGATERKPFVHFWMHTGMVYLGGEKMSKSLGNMVFVRDLAPQFGADSMRLYLSNCHYRDELHYDESDLRRAFFRAQELADALLPSSGSAPALDPTPYRERFCDCMNDDLDTPGAISVLQELGQEIRAGRAEGHEVALAQQQLRELSGVLGLRLNGGNT